MAPTLVTLVPNLYDGSGKALSQGWAVLVPQLTLTDASDAMLITMAPVTIPMGSSAQIIASDSPGPLPAGWAWSISFRDVPGNPAGWSFLAPAGPCSFTATSAAPCVFTWTPTSAFTSADLSPLPNGTVVTLAGGSLPAGFAAATPYYVVASSGTTFQLSATLNGSGIASTSTGSGTFSVTQYELSALAQVGTAAALTLYDPLGAASAALAAAEAYSSPTTALGDTVYGGASGVPARLAGNTASTRKFLRELGTGTAAAAPAWDTLLVSDIPGVTVQVPKPAGVTATDTPNVVAAITALTTALASGPATLQFQDGTYQIDSNTAVIRSPNTTTVASASNGAEPSTWVPGSPGTLTVASAAGFPSSGQVWVAASGSTLALVSYTGTTSTTFTGCLYVSGSATGTIATGGAVTGCLSNFAVRSAGRTVIQQAPNRSGLPNNTTGDIFVIADCTDFSVQDITLDGNRDVVAPLAPLTATAASAQKTVTVAAGAGAAYFAGQRLSVMGGLGSSEQGQSDGEVAGWGYSGGNLIVSSVTSGGGAGGGDLITFTANLAHSYTQISSTPFNDDFGPYAYAGAYVSPYQTASQNSVAGRTLSGEDQQGGIHLMNCQQFALHKVKARNVWESPIKLGTGFSGAQTNSSLLSIGDACIDGSVVQCSATHGYDQGISIWFGDRVTVTGNYCSGAGWAGISLSMTDHCTVSGNLTEDNYYRPAAAVNQGSGIALEGAQGNTVSGNIIRNNYQAGIFLWKAPGVFNFGLPDNSSNPYITAFIPANTAAGTSIAVSSSSAFQAGGRYSIVDASRTEAVSCASIVDSTHITLNENTKYQHAANSCFSVRVPADNVFTGNIINGTQSYNAILHQTAVRSKFTGNLVKNWNLSVNSNQGINMTAAAAGTLYLAGDGTSLIGNTFGPPGPTGEHAILIDSSGDHTITGNSFIGFEYASSNPVKLQGIYDTTVADNHVHDIGDGTGSAMQGIYLTTGSHNGLACARVSLSGNVVTRTKNEGILALGGDSLTITGNKVSSCGGNAGIDLRGVTNSAVTGNVSNSNSGSGILLENNSGTGCTGNRVSGNTCRDDGSGYSTQTGIAWTQAYGIRESGAANDNLFTLNECDANGTGQISTSGAASYAWNNVISGAVAAGTSPGSAVTQSYGGVFGDGSDGGVTLDGTTSFSSFASLSGGNYTLIRDVFASSLTVNSGVTLFTAGYRVFCTGTIANSGTISDNGAAAASNSGAAATAGGSLAGSTAGANGGTGAGSTAVKPNGSGNTGTGGAGGTGSSGAGGSSVPAKTNTSIFRSPGYPANVVVGGSATILSGAAGGSGGGGDGTNNGGGGGSGGGLIELFGHAVVNSGTISATGGNGFTPAAGNCGGGGGGGGGDIIVYSLTAWTAGTTSVAGGTAGSGVGTGTAGTAGTSGTVLNVIVQ